MGEGYTALFFLDEAVALAAGHRPCAQCRRREYDRFLDCWSAAFGERPRATVLDRKMRHDRLCSGGLTQRRHRADIDGLPDGAFIFLADDERPAIVLGDLLLPFAAEGYMEPLPRPGSANVQVLTPVCSIAVLKAGYRPQLHPSAINSTSTRETPLQCAAILTPGIKLHGRSET